MPATLAEIDAELLDLTNQRASLLDAIGALPALEQRLLERDAPDADFLQIDTRRRRYDHGLAEVDRREALLLRAVPGARRDERRSAWLTYVDRFHAIATEASAAATALRTAQQKIHELHTQAARAGFNPHQSYGAVLPVIEARIAFDYLTGLPDLVPHLRRLDPTPREAPALFGVRLTQAAVVLFGGRCPVGFNAGETAGFSAGEAWALVDAGRGEFADARRVPERPAPSKARKGKGR